MFGIIQSPLTCPLRRVACQFYFPLDTRFFKAQIMRLTSFSLWLGCLASSTLAFSSLSKPTTFGLLASRGDSQSQPQQHNLKTRLGVASTDSINIAEMERGVGGRIEEAFGAAKERGEAAFVTFITAGYPNAQGTTLGAWKLRNFYSKCMELYSHSQILLHLDYY